MINIYKLFTFLITFFLIASFNVDGVNACASSQKCPSGYTCIGLTPENQQGTCEQIGCFSNVICPTGWTCMADICLQPSGGGGGGGGKYVGCTIRYDCPANTTPDWTRPIYYGCKHWSNDRICGDLKVGSDAGRSNYCDRCADVEGVCKLTAIYRPTCVENCSPTAPGIPSLLSPANDSVVSTTNPTLSWSSTGWGTTCTTTNNQFTIYIGTNPSSLAFLGTVNSSTTNISFSGSNGQTYYWKVRASNGEASRDSDTWSFTINRGPWWQSRDGDLTANGAIASDIPSGSVLSMNGLGGFPGLPSYGTTLNLYPSYTDRISTPTWNANTTSLYTRLFNYDFFENLISDEINLNTSQATDSSLRSVGFTTTSGYEWFKTDSDLSIDSDIDFGNRRVVLFVDGNLNINGRITLNDGSGFFTALVSGDINIDPNVAGDPSIEGIYLSNGAFSTGAGSSQFNLRGAVATYTNINLERDIINNNSAAEVFTYGPDQVMLFPENLRYRRTKWAEVNP